MNYDIDLLNDIYSMYIESKIGLNDICTQCREYSHKMWNPLAYGPVPIFHVGKEFRKQEKRLLVVGKVAYGWDDYHPTWKEIFEGNEEIKTLFINKIETRVEELFFEGITKYFSFLKYSLSNVYGDINTAFNNIAITNFVHCNDGDVNDYLRQQVRHNCASKSANGFVHKEIEILKPTHILILTKTFQKKYERYIERENLNIHFIEHPSSIGRDKKSFTEDIRQFLASN